MSINAQRNSNINILTLILALEHYGQILFNITLELNGCAYCVCTYTPIHTHIEIHVRHL